MPFFELDLKQSVEHIDSAASVVMVLVVTNLSKHSYDFCILTRDSLMALWLFRSERSY